MKLTDISKPLKPFIASKRTKHGAYASRNPAHRQITATIRLDDKDRGPGRSARGIHPRSSGRGNQPRLGLRVQQGSRLSGVSDRLIRRSGPDLRIRRVRCSCVLVFPAEADHGVESDRCFAPGWKFVTLHPGRVHVRKPPFTLVYFLYCNNFGLCLYTS